MNNQTPDDNLLDIEREVLVLKSLAEEYKKPIFIYVWKKNNIMFIDYNDIQFVGSGNSKFIRLVKNSDDVFSTTMIPLTEIQAVKIEIPKTETYEIMKKLEDLGAVFLNPEELIHENKEESKLSYT